MSSNVRYARSLRFTTETDCRDPPRRRSTDLESNVQDPLQVNLHHFSNSGRRLEQFSGLSPHRVHPSTPVSQQLLGLPGILTLVDVLKHQPHLVSHAHNTLFKGHQLPLLGFFFPPVHPFLEPHPPRPLQPILLAGLCQTLPIPNLVACLHHILDDVELIVHDLSFPEFAADAYGLGGAHVDSYMLDRLGVAAVPQQFCSNGLPTRGIFTGRSQKHRLGHKISKHRQVIIPLTPVHFVGSHPLHVVEAQPCMRRSCVGEVHPPHPSVALAEDLADPLHWHLTHRGKYDGLGLLCEVLDGHLPRRGHTVHLAVVAAASSREGKHNYAIFLSCRHCIGLTWL
jgi:hypothetical protein